MGKDSATVEKSKKSKKGGKSPKETPLMKQYYAIKAKHPGALLLFRVGDFYETFGEDAIRASKILGIVLTQRKNGAASTVELAGFPHHSLEVYLPKLVRAGERVAICDQLEDPKQTKTIVKRGVTELVTPGVALNDQILDSGSNNFLAAIHFDKERMGAAFVDISTGEFYAAEGTSSYIEKLIAGFNPSEIIYERNKKDQYRALVGDRFHHYHLEDWAFQPEFADELLKRQFKTHSLKGFGIASLSSAIIASGAALHYLSETQHERLQHISTIRRLDAGEHMWLDRFTQRNLEIFYSSHERGKSLIDIMDRCTTPMGSRLLKNWLAFPLLNIQKIEERHQIVAAMMGASEDTEMLRGGLKSVGDMERTTSRLSIGKINPKELFQLAISLESAESIAALAKDGFGYHLLEHALKDCDSAAEIIREAIDEQCPALLQKGNVIASGFNAELDELRSLAHSGKDHLIQIQQREAVATGISSLKIGFNNVFGYYLEVTNAHKDKVPTAWTRKQTLVNAERYITDELKEYEQKILSAQERIQVLEAQLYQDLIQRLASFIAPLQEAAKALATLDCLSAFAMLAAHHDYARPTLKPEAAIDIKQGRHPVIEQEFPLGEQYIPNDIYLDKESQQIIMLTGPNMSGKSALLRQCALISLMAQVGSFVPAASATLPLIDKLFVRVGASDNISQGESTFMVEMNETASILNNLSAQSLVLLDEIGRGTSTYDGVSIAWSIADFLHTHSHRPLTLFATHYHELNEMANQHDRIKNFTIAIRETKDNIIFLRTLIPGGSEHSFGIQVARMAGMPASMISKAKSVLNTLESKATTEEHKERLRQEEDQIQLSMFQLDDPVLSQIKQELVNIDINGLTPVEALFKLNEIKKLLGHPK